jgi:hypothetical protein
MGINAQISQEIRKRFLAHSLLRQLRHGATMPKMFQFRAFLDFFNLRTSRVHRPNLKQLYTLAWLPSNFWIEALSFANKKKAPAERALKWLFYALSG